jgi:hypothetical protein
VKAVCTAVEASWVLDKDRGEGYLVYGSATFAARTVAAYRRFLPLLFDAEPRYALWTRCGPQVRRSMVPTDDDVACDKVLSLLVASRAIPAAESFVLRHTYPGLVAEPTGRSVAQAAIDDAVVFTGRFDELARNELENLTGFIVKRLKDKFAKHYKSTGLTAEETKRAALCAQYLNSNVWADLPSSYDVPADDRDRDSDSSGEDDTSGVKPTSDTRKTKFRRTAGQGLHVPHDCLSRFTRRLEGLLQRTLLHPREAANTAVNCSTTSPSSSETPLECGPCGGTWSVQLTWASERPSAPPTMMSQ